MHKVQYCLAIRKTNKTLILEEIKKNRELFAYFEIWLDYIEDLNNKDLSSDFLDSDFIEKLISSTDQKLILLTRRDKLEKDRLSLEKKIEIAKIISGTEVLYDFDILAQKDDFEAIRLKCPKVKFLLSCHNYTLTPGDSELEIIYKKMSEYSPEIYKFAAFCNNEQDALRLLSFGLKLRDKGDKHIVLGMGKHGIITRVFGTIWGNEMIFCPVSSNELTAQGQLSREQLEQIWETRIILS